MIDFVGGGRITCVAMESERNTFCLRQLSFSKKACRVLTIVMVVSWAAVDTVRAMESAPFEIDTSATDIPGGGALSAAFLIDTRASDVPGGGGFSEGFVIDTRGSDVVGGGSLSAAFVIDTTAMDVLGGGAFSSAFTIDSRATDADGLAALSAYFTIDTREDSEKLQYKYALWAEANTPAGQRGMNDVTDLFGISNLLAFALGWEAGDPDTWYMARLHEVVQGGGSPGVWLRTHRRNDLPELLWSWEHSADLQGFPNIPTVQDSSASGLGGLMEQWDVRVPLPTTMDKNFYRLEIYYNNNNP